MIGSERAYLGILFLSPTIFFTSILAGYRGLFQGISNMTPIALSQVLEQICNIFISIFCASMLVNNSLELGAAGGTVGTTVGAIIAIIFLCMTMRKQRILYNLNISVPYLNCELERRESDSTKDIIFTFFKYGIPVILTSGIQYVGAVIDLALVKNRLMFAGFDYSTGDILYGLLGKYKTLIYVPLAIIAALSAAVIPSLVKSVVLKDRNNLFKKIRFALKTSLSISIPSCVGLALLSRPIYLILFSTEYSSGYTLMLYGSSLVVFMSIVQIQTTILQGLNKFYSVFTSLFIGVLLKLLSNYFLVGIPSININGAIIGSIVGFLVPMIINGILIKKYIGFKGMGLINSIKPFISSIVMGIFIIIFYKFNSFLFMNNNSIIIKYLTFGLVLIFGCIVYFVFIVVLRYFNKEDLEFIPSSIIRIIPKKIMSKFFN